MPKEIIYKKGWKKAVKYAWDEAKLTNLDLSGLGMAGYSNLAAKHGRSGDAAFQAAIFRGCVGTLRTYTEYCVISQKGLERLEKEFGTHDYEPQDEIVDYCDYDNEGDLAIRFSDLINGLEKLIAIYPKVHFQIGGEDRQTLEKGDNWRHYILIKEESE